MHRGKIRGEKREKNISSLHLSLHWLTVMFKTDRKQTNPPQNVEGAAVSEYVSSCLLFRSLSMESQIMQLINTSDWLGFSLILPSLIYRGFSAGFCVCNRFSSLIVGSVNIDSMAGDCFLLCGKCYLWAVQGAPGIVIKAVELDRPAFTLWFYFHTLNRRANAEGICSFWFFSSFGWIHLQFKWRNVDDVFQSARYS